MFNVHKLKCLGLSLRVQSESEADDDENVESADGRLLHSLAADAPHLIDGSAVMWLFNMSGVFITTSAGAALGLPLNTDGTDSGSAPQTGGVLGTRPLRCRVEAAARRSAAAGAVVVVVVEVVGRTSLTGPTVGDALSGGRGVDGPSGRQTG